MSLHHFAALDFIQASTGTSESWTDENTGVSGCSQVDFLASLSVRPGDEEARRMTVISGRKCCALYPKRGPLGSLVRMLLVSSQWNSSTVFLKWTPKAMPLASSERLVIGWDDLSQTKRWQILKRSITTSSRFLFRLSVSMPNTEEIESSLWPTPNVDATGGTGTAKQALKAVMGQKRPSGSKIQKRLKDMAKLFPTPKASQHGPDFGKLERSKTGLSLETLVQLLPTPTCQDARNNGGPSQDARNTRPLNAVAGGSLNPPWVEWLMGYPTGWTDLKGLATPSSRSNSSKSCGRSSRSKKKKSAKK